VWFKNLRIYRLAGSLELTEQELEDGLVSQAFRPCGQMELDSAGFIPPLGQEEGPLTHSVNGCRLFCMRRAERLLPAAVVNEVVARQVDVLTPMAGRGGNTLALHEKAELRVRAPTKVVEIVIANLMRNALNYTRDGSVEVTVTADSVRVSDTGVGMSGEELERAFDPFYRADESRGLTQGHGLGLSIVKRLVRQFDWSISAHSRPGEGTTLEVCFAPTAAHN